ncbi:MAG: hypothetical protein HY465_04640, partial [Deltaproteobacteria bacterium]|nr:hypothetical protein [Deltaproteobacteria bacterium]
MTPTNRKRHLQITIIVALSLFAMVIIGAKGILESATLRRTVNKAIAARSGWEVEVARVQIIPWTGQITLWGLSARHPVKGHVLTAGDLTARVSLLSLIRGRLSLSSLILNDVSLVLPPRAAKREHPPLDVKKLFVLQNIVLEEGRVHNFRLQFGKEKEIRAETLEFSLGRTLVGKSGVTIAGHTITTTSYGKTIAEAATVSCEAAT